MKEDVKKLLVSYTIIHGLGSLISWIMFTTNHPFRLIPSENLRYGISVVFIILIYMGMGYITMLARAKFLKSLEHAFYFTGIIIGVNLLSAVIFWIGTSQLALNWMKAFAKMLNFPGYLFLLNPGLSILNLSMIILLPPLAFMIGLLIRQVHH